MKKNSDNFNEDKFERVVKLLNELPKVKADDNFEFNLMLKIQNKNFELNTPRKISLNPWKIFIPAAAATVTFILVFFLINKEDNPDNPFQMIPKMRTEISSNFNNSLNFLNNNRLNKEITDKDVIITKSSINEDKSINVDNQILSDNSKAEKKVEFPFDISSSTNIDEVLGNKRSETKIDKRASLAGKNNATFFDGFFIREEVDQRYIDEMRARFDSLKKKLNLPKESEK